ncbi:MAG TPA: FxSxx-COOH system tetratricopeptide repeat protein [Streptosporangiaceae bacterium]
MVSASRASSNAADEALPGGGWPVQSGLVPPLADCYSSRPETGFGPMSNLAAGETAVLTRPEAMDGHSLAAAGGTGKTQLAVAFARAFWQSGDADLVVWAPAASRDAIVTGYARALAETGAAQAGPDQDTQAARFVSWLADTPRRWLVVLDDLTDPADLAGLWPRGPAGRVLVTTRLQAASMRAPGRKILQVGAFSRREALNYLTAKLYSDPDQRIEALDLAADLDYLPLALAIAADTIAESGLGCRGYRVQYADRKQRINLDAADGYAATAAAAWSLALDRADQLAPAGLARPALALVSLLGSSGIPGAVLTSTAASAYITGSADDGQPAEASVTQALQNLARTGLITIDPASPAAAVRMHHLVQSTIAAVLPPAVLEQTAIAAADALAQAWPPRDTSPQLAQALRSCAASLHQAAGELLWQPEGHQVLLRAGRSLDEGKVTSAAISYWQMMGDTSSRVLGPGHAQALLASDHLAGAYELAGQLDDAIATRGQGLAEREQAFGPGHPETLAARGRLARACLDAGRLADAIPLYERTLAGREWVHGPDHPQTLAARSDLGAAYRAGGRLADAITVFQRTLADQEMLLGPDHPGTLAARGSLAAALHSAGQLDEALPLYEHALADRERVLGPDHPDTITSRAGLAHAYLSADRMKEAVPLYKRAVADRERVLGPDHPDTLSALASLAAAYHATHRPAESAALLRRALTDCERVLPADHPLTQSVRDQLADFDQT